MYVIYFWLGSQSSQDEKGAAAILATKMDDELNGAATQVRVVMGKEPSHFVRCFKGTMVVHAGGKASGFKNKADADTYDEDGVSLFHVRGVDAADTRAVQVAEKAASLNSGDCFVLLTPTTMYNWFGSSSNASEQTIAKTVADKIKLKRSVEEVTEGSEPDAFWEALGGKGEYPTAKLLPAGSREPMLFSVSNSTGTPVIEPVLDYSQEDLDYNDVFILDTFTTIWVWVGEYANEAEKKVALEMAEAYIKEQQYGDDTTIIQIKSGAEPSIFTCHFLGWDADKGPKKFVDPYQAKLDAIKAANPVEEPEAPPPPKRNSVGSGEVFSQDFAEPGADYSVNYDELKKPAEQLPKGVDPRKREQYLSDADFEKVLGSPRGEFNSLKPWKQNQLKKAAGLF